MQLANKGSALEYCSPQTEAEYFVHVSAFYVPMIQRHMILLELLVLMESQLSVSFSFNLIPDRYQLKHNFLLPMMFCTANSAVLYLAIAVSAQETPTLRISLTVRHLPGSSWGVPDKQILRLGAYWK